MDETARKPIWAGPSLSTLSSRPDFYFLCYYRNQIIKENGQCCKNVTRCQMRETDRFFCFLFFFFNIYLFCERKVYRERASFLFSLFSNTKEDITSLEREKERKNVPLTRDLNTTGIQLPLLSIRLRMLCSPSPACPSHYSFCPLVSFFIYSSSCFGFFIFHLCPSRLLKVVSICWALASIARDLTESTEQEQDENRSSYS